MKLSNFFVFVVSIFFSLIVLYLERMVGIDWDYHPDANTYITYAESAPFIFSEFMNFFGSGYYFVSNFFNGSLFFLISLNIIIFVFQFSGHLDFAYTP